MSVQSVMGFDYGHKRIGVAFGQTLTATANPISVIYTKNKDFWTEIDALIKEWRPNRCVVGLPRHADGSNNSNTLKIQQFCQTLRQRYQLPVETIDETLSSIAAQKRLSFQSKRLNNTIDALAAQIILETWFAEYGK